MLTTLVEREVEENHGACRTRLILIGEPFPYFSKFRNNWRFVSRYGGLPSLFVKSPEEAKNRLVNHHILGKNVREYSGT